MDLVGKIGDGLYTPENFGLQPVMASTACYRGYIMRYVINNKELIIDGFLVRI